MRYIIKTLGNSAWQIFDTLTGQAYGIVYTDKNLLAAECEKMNALYSQQQGFSIGYPNIY